MVAKSPILRPIVHPFARIHMGRYDRYRIVTNECARFSFISHVAWANALGARAAPTLIDSGNKILPKGRSKNSLRFERPRYEISNIRQEDQKFVISKLCNFEFLNFVARIFE